MKQLSRTMAFIFSLFISTVVFAGEGVGAGGGGNTVKNAPTLGQIVDAIKQSKATLLAYLDQGTFESKLNYSRFSQSQWFVFDNPKLREQIQNLKIEIRTGQPCIDSDGIKTDGSVFGLDANEICISAFSLRTKVDLSDYDAQIAGLVLHEATHLVGADESEAVKAQVQAIGTLKRKTPTELQQDFARSYQKLQATIRQLRTLKSANPQTHAMCFAMQGLGQDLIRMDESIHRAGFAQFESVLRAKLLFEAARIEIAHISACITDSTISGTDREKFFALDKSYRSYGYVLVAVMVHQNDAGPFDRVIFPGLRFSRRLGDELRSLDTDYYGRAPRLDSVKDWQNEISEIASSLESLFVKRSRIAESFEAKLVGPPLIPADSTEESICTTYFFDSKEVPWGTVDLRNTPIPYKAKKVWVYDSKSPAQNFSEDLFAEEDGTIISIAGRYEIGWSKTDPGPVFLTVYEDKIDGSRSPLTNEQRLPLNGAGTMSVGGRIYPYTYCNLPRFQPPGQDK